MTRRVFVCHSSTDKEFAKIIVAKLKGPETSPWIDHEQIFTGDDILDIMGEGLTSMDILLFLISREALKSSWVDLELKYATWKEINERRIIIRPFRLSDIPISELPWFLRHRKAPVISQDIDGASIIIKNILSVLEQRYSTFQVEPIEKPIFQRDSRIEKLIKDIRVGDWEHAQIAGLRMSAYITEHGSNELFFSLLSYLDCPDEDLKWGALQTIESFSDIAPWLYDLKLLTELSKHNDFSVRSMVAMVCYNFANWNPHLVPINILFRLSHPDEDYYVQNPAIGALKTLARYRVSILRMFFVRLRSKDSWTREFIANAIYDISSTEPEILNPEDIEDAYQYIKSIGDDTALHFIEKTKVNIKSAKFGDQWKYSPF